MGRLDDATARKSGPIGLDVALAELATCQHGVVTLAQLRALGRTGPPLVALHRVRRLHADDVADLRGVPITSVARTLVDLAAVLPAQALERAVHQAEVLALLDVGPLREALARAPTGRGTRGLRAILAEPSPGTTRSALEERFLTLCRTAGLPLPRLNVHVPTSQGLLEVDACWPAARLIVELDGAGAHRTRRAFHADRRRDTALAAEGYLVLRLTCERVTRERDEIRSELTRVLGPPVSEWAGLTTSQVACPARSRS